MSHYSSTGSDNKCVIFCNTAKSCNWVSLKLEGLNIPHCKLHGDRNPKARFQDYEKFIGESVRVLVCTDIASRGLDCNLINLVVNFDCPFNTTDYIHRSGRTGRAKQLYNLQDEQVITFITQNKDVILANKILEAASKNQQLGNITSKRNSFQENHVKAIKDHSANKR